MLKPRPIYCPNVLLLHSENNTPFPIEEAKTVIQKFSNKSKVIVVYINHEINDLDESQVVIKNYDYSIYKEIRKKSGNIASEFLMAGADYVYYVKADADEYRAAFVHIFDILSNEYPIICISSKMASSLKAGAIIIANTANEEYFKDLSKTVHEPAKLYTTEKVVNLRIDFSENILSFSQN